MVSVHCSSRPFQVVPGFHRPLHSPQTSFIAFHTPKRDAFPAHFNFRYLKMEDPFFSICFPTRDAYILTFSYDEYKEPSKNKQTFVVEIRCCECTSKAETTTYIKIKHQSFRRIRRKQ